MHVEIISFENKSMAIKYAQDFNSNTNNETMIAMPPIWEDE